MVIITDFPALVARIKPADGRTCRVLLRCTNVATTSVPNGILGRVPACQSCFDRMRWLAIIDRHNTNGNDDAA